MKWFFGEEKGQPPIANHNPGHVVAVKKGPAEGLNDIPLDNKTEQIKEEILLNDLKSPEREIRTQAQGELKNIPHTAVLKLLERALAGENDILRIIENLNVLETFREVSPAARQIFNKYAAHEDAAVRLAALRSVSKYRDDESFDMVSSRVKDEDPEARRKILNLLCWNFEQKCLPFAMSAFHDADSQVRRAAAQIAEALRAEEAVLGLIALLSDPDKDVQDSANSGLKKITGKDFGFNASASRGHNEKAIDGWKKWCLGNQAGSGHSKHRKVPE
jgi:HEAT repeat protein